MIFCCISATVLAVIGAFYRDIITIIRERGKWVVFAYVVIGSVPAGIIGLLFKDSIESLAQDPVIICCCLMLTSTPADAGAEVTALRYQLGASRISSGTGSRMFSGIGNAAGCESGVVLLLRGELSSRLNGRQR